MNKPNLMVSWIIENFKRLGTKMPSFFKIWAWIGGFALALTSLPQLISQLDAFGIKIPDIFNTKVNEIVKIAGSTVLVMSWLTSQSKPVGVDQNGQVIKATDTQKLPFSAAAEKKIVIKKDIPTVEINPASNSINN